MRMMRMSRVLFLFLFLSGFVMCCITGVLNSYLGSERALLSSEVFLVDGRVVLRTCLIELDGCEIDMRDRVLRELTVWSRSQEDDFYR